MEDACIIPSKKKLDGKVAIVTGGVSGIGEATARSFAAHGAHAIVIADVQDEKGQDVAVSIGPERCSYVHCDVTDEEQVKTLVESTVEKYRRLDVMFSNAGVPSTSDQTVLDFDLSALERLFAVNVRGMAACVKHAARVMVKGGSVICTASVSASLGYEKFTDYVMSKHAVLGLVRSASLQLAPRGVRVNAVSPGPIGTPLLRDLLRVGEEELEKFVESNAALKIGTVMKERHVAEAVSFLASDESEFITGHNLAVDGGLSH
ncbi:Sex determination protein tasselseed-2 [Morus notabilis]|uniref:Sex determination protein tasselseed-2 n=1 Tax=Morus notabilis TaxID=981085 RepID=W9SB59_9ROSA|nr:(-)-isopiperitenol/(-)-carveol dehydrogenase, mitochondrial [Morus notabilis]EXC34228.1 Sex determination protein tasselseed-2 [Morus notabilis]